MFMNDEDYDESVFPSEFEFQSSYNGVAVKQDYNIRFNNHTVIEKNSSYNTVPNYNTKPNGKAQLVQQELYYDEDMLSNIKSFDLSPFQSKSPYAPVEPYDLLPGSFKSIYDLVETSNRINDFLNENESLTANISKFNTFWNCKSDDCEFQICLYVARDGSIIVEEQRLSGDWFTYRTILQKLLEILQPYKSSESKNISGMMSNIMAF